MGQEPSQVQGQVGSGEQVNISYHRPRRQKRYWKEGKEKPRQTADELSGGEGQGSQTKAKPSHSLPAGRDFNNQDQLATGSVGVRSGSRKRCWRGKQGATASSTWDAWASDGDPNEAEAEEGMAGGTVLLIRPPLNTHPVDFELNMPTSPRPRGTWRTLPGACPCQKVPGLERKSWGVRSKALQGRPQGPSCLQDHLHCTRGAPGRQHPGGPVPVRTGDPKALGAQCQPEIVQARRPKIDEKIPNRGTGYPAGHCPHSWLRPGWL